MLCSYAPGARVTDIRQITGSCRDRGGRAVSRLCPHATARVALIEAGSGSESDLEDAIDRLLPARTSTGTGMAAPDMAVTMCCWRSYHPRSPCRYLTAGQRSVRGKAWCWWIRTLTTPDRKVRLSFLGG
jgi:hypothetical protein